jgi:transcriptional regulator with XRE-family HTH domain
MARTIAATPLAEWIREQIDERDGWGIRTLARRMTPQDPEISRRALNRYLYEGSYPSAANLVLLADALGVPVAEVPAPSPFPSRAA